jgi:hypothetical protein
MIYGRKKLNGNLTILATFLAMHLINNKYAIWLKYSPSIKANMMFIRCFTTLNIAL